MNRNLNYGTVYSNMQTISNDITEAEIAGVKKSNEKVCGTFSFYSVRFIDTKDGKNKTFMALTPNYISSLPEQRQYYPAIRREGERLFFQAFPHVKRENMVNPGPGQQFDCGQTSGNETIQQIHSRLLQNVDVTRNLPLSIVGK